jgi:hypothetical protein
LYDKKKLGYKENTMTTVDPSLETLNQKFFEIATLNLNSEQKEFITSKWKQLRNYACQNAGCPEMGKTSHEIGLRQAFGGRKLFQKLIKGIEMNGFRLWKESGTDLHLEAIFRLFFDDESRLKDVDFSMQEKLALFWKYDETIITQFRQRFEQIFKDFYHQMIWTQHDPLVTEMLIGNLIAIYPLFRSTAWTRSRSAPADRRVLASCPLPYRCHSLWSKTKF